MRQGWKKVKERIDGIDTFDCTANEVAVALQELATFIDKGGLE